MLYVGLTGNIASGKTAAAQRFAARGATILDADELAREVVQPGAPAYDPIVRRWGDRIVGPDGALDREALRHIVFGDRSQLDELNAIVHPAIVELRRQRVGEARERGDSVLMYVAPLLFERHLADEFDRIILVDAPRGVRLRRLIESRGIPAEDAVNMISSQMPAELKRARADFVIENTGSLHDLERQVDAVWERLTASGARSSLAV